MTAFESTFRLLQNFIENKPLDAFYGDTIKIKDFYSFYDRSIYRAFIKVTSTLSLNSKIEEKFVQGIKLLDALKELKKFMKKSEFLDIKKKIHMILEENISKILISSPNSKVNKICNFFDNLIGMGDQEIKNQLSRLKCSIKDLLNYYINNLTSNYIDSKSSSDKPLAIIEKLFSLHYFGEDERKKFKEEIYGKMKLFQEKELLLNHLIKNEEFTEDEKQKITFLTQTIYSSISKSAHSSKLPQSLEMVIFGSFVNGFALKNSDIDCTFLTNSFVDERPFLSIINSCLENLRSQGFEITLLNMKTIRVPIIKIKHEIFGAMDLAINNVLGVANSKLLYSYSKISHYCSRLGKLIKLWGKNHQVITSTSISSYGLTLLLIYFLQIKRILPSLQAISKLKKKIQKKSYLMPK